MQCRIISKENLAEVKQMDAFVKHHEKSHFLQTPAWAQVKEAWDWRGILACEDDRVVGALSVLIRPLPIGFSLMYAPRGPVCDRNDPYAMACLLGAADDLLCMWLYHKYGYICIPSTNKLSTQLYECVLLDPKTGEHIYIQVKNGNVEINADDYEQLQGDTWFLTTKGRVINAEKYNNRKVADPSELYEFAISDASTHILPPSIKAWVNFLEENEHQKTSGQRKGIIFDTNKSYDAMTALLLCWLQTGNSR